MIRKILSLFRLTENDRTIQLGVLIIGFIFGAFNGLSESLKNPQKRSENFELNPIWRDKQLAKQRYEEIQKPMPKLQRKTHLKDELGIRKRLLVR